MVGVGSRYLTWIKLGSGAKQFNQFVPALYDICNYGYTE